MAWYFGITRMRMSDKEKAEREEKKWRGRSAFLGDRGDARLGVCKI